MPLEQEMSKTGPMFQQRWCRLDATQALSFCGHDCQEVVRPHYRRLKKSWKGLLWCAACMQQTPKWVRDVVGDSARRVSRWEWLSSCQHLCMGLKTYIVLLKLVVREVTLLPGWPLTCHLLRLLSDEKDHGKCNWKTQVLLGIWEVAASSTVLSSTSSAVLSHMYTSHVCLHVLLPRDLCNNNLCLGQHQISARLIYTLTKRINYNKVFFKRKCELKY